MTTRRDWIRTLGLGMAGLLAAERAPVMAQPRNDARALADPRDAIRITGIEIIPVQSLRSIFVKMPSRR